MGFDLMNLVQMAGGLALFIYGMTTMGNGLEQAAGAKLEKTLEKMTGNIFSALLMGMVVTAVIQSSSATTVMVVGFVNAGIMTLKQSVGVILGANIGTTITAQILRLDSSGAMGESFLMQMLKPKNFAYAMVLIGIILMLTSKSKRRRNIADILIGFGVLFIGMATMEGAVAPLADIPQFSTLFATISNPILGVLVGAGVTAIIQSSSASVGILQALSTTGAITYSAAIPIILGQNIGTCITAVLASIGMKVNAKRTTVIHLMFNIIGTIIFTIICMVTPYVGLIESLTPGNPVAQIANAHTIFNIATTLLLLPFGAQMAEIAEKILPDSKKADDEDLRLKYIRPFESSYAIGNSAVAVSQVKDEVGRMSQMVAKNISDAFDTLISYDEKAKAKIIEREEYIDYLNKGISEYIVSLMANERSMDDSRKINGYYAIVSNLERIGDHAVNIVEYADDMKKWDLKFSDNVLDELAEMKKQCLASLDNVKEVDAGNAEAVLKNAVVLEQKTDDMRDKYFKKQMQRLKKGKCKPQSGIVFSEILTDFERMGDHVLNIAQEYQGME